MARPEKWKPEYEHVARAAARLGATDREIAEALSVSERTLNNWKLKKPELVEALKVGKEAADDRVEQSLYRRALGYSHDAVKVMTVDGAVHREQIVEHYPPDVTAAIFWLKNRRKADWRDKQEFEVSGGISIKADPLDEKL